MRTNFSPIGSHSNSVCASMVLPAGTFALEPLNNPPADAGSISRQAYDRSRPDRCHDGIDRGTGLTSVIGEAEQFADLIQREAKVARAG
jgi:hypothetical protein